MRQNEFPELVKNNTILAVDLLPLIQTRKDEPEKLFSHHPFADNYFQTSIKDEECSKRETTLSQQNPASSQKCLDDAISFREQKMLEMLQYKHHHYVLRK